MDDIDKVLQDMDNDYVKHMEKKAKRSKKFEFDTLKYGKKQ
jgi:hypothetical protein